MLTLLSIVWNSFKTALQELRNNKLRTFLSLFGITIGIFCIIGVLATVESLQTKVQNDIKSLGTNTIYIDKWEYGGGGGDYPWWKYVKRPYPKVREMEAIKARSSLASAVCYTIDGSSVLEYDDNILKGVNCFGVTEDFNSVVTVSILYGRYITETEFNQGAPVILLGYTNAENLFGSAERALGHEVKYKSKSFKVAGVIKKQGQSFVGGWQFDEAVIFPYKVMAGMFNVQESSPKLLVKGRANVPSVALLDELRGIMRSVHRLSPRQEDDFALNDINMFSEKTDQMFGSINMAGWFIAGLSLIVGTFGIANIMFVTVRERTSQIGLKKAIGAKSSIILTEFLLESSFLSLLGGLLGLLLVFILTKALSAVMPFPISISMNTLTLAISICLVVGILAGIIPASVAAKMNPVAAIRSK
ncbi:MAG TPA: ABC transporter permease [Segetibacter sp.]|jgi:putative ABC transport system permease protein